MEQKKVDLSTQTVQPLSSTQANIQNRRECSEIGLDQRSEFTNAPIVDTTVQNVSTCFIWQGGPVTTGLVRY